MSDALLLIGRDTPHARDVYETHADRLVRRGVADDAHAVTYEREPTRELRDRFAAVDADRVYAVPMCAAHTYDTTDELPAALSAVPGDVRYCDPVGRTSAVTDVITDRATEQVPAAEDASLVLVGFGSSSTPYARQVAEYQADRLREQTAYGEVVTCYLMQNPAVECVRYNVSDGPTVAVPLFLARNEATDERIPADLDLERGGIAYTDPLGDHPRVTDAIHAEVEKQRALADDEQSRADPVANRRPLAADGEGEPR